MSTIRPKTAEKKDIFLYRTEVENLFINEFLPEAPGDYVKVFLFGLMYAQYDQPMDQSKLSMILGLREEEIEEAWIYWESKGLVTRTSNINAQEENERGVSFTSLVESLYGKAVEEPTPDSSRGAAEQPPEDVPHYISIDDTEFEKMFESRAVDGRLRRIYTRFQAVTGRTVSRRETGKIEDAVKVYGITPEIFEFAIDYCAELEKYSIDYIFKVALRWTEEGCKTADEAKKLLEKHSLRNRWYTRVFRALGFNRPPAPADREIMDRWFDEMGFSIDEVVEACNQSAGIREPNLRYVNKVLENKRLEKGGINTRPAAEKSTQTATPVSDGGSPVSRKVLAEFYEYIRAEGVKDRNRRINEVLDRLPGMKDIMEAESRMNSKLMSLRPGDASHDERQMLRAERIRLDDARKAMLESGGFPADYMDRKYRCGICRDTGYTDSGMVCSCARERAEEAFRWNAGNN